jgi:hypothetical protein
MRLLAKTKAAARRASRAETHDDRSQSRDASALAIQGAPCAPRRRRQGGDLDAQPAGEKEPAHFESYEEIANIFRAAAKDETVKAFVITGAGGNFCSGGDVLEIIGPLVEMDTVGFRNSPA